MKRLLIQETAEDGTPSVRVSLNLNETPAQHTPGPWKLSEDSTGLYDLIADFDNTWIATIHGGYDEKTNRDEKDARLIAAAPDLLEACKTGLAAMIAWGGKCEANGEMILARESVIKAEVIRAAIQKAEAGQ